jgi:hypothetical protein
MKHHVTLPPNLDIGVKENRCFNSSKTPEFRLARSAGGREDPKLSLLLKLHPIVNVLTPPSDHRHVHVC